MDSLEKQENTSDKKMTVINITKELTMEKPSMPISGIPSLQSLEVLKSLSNPLTGVSTQDIVGMIGGGLLGWWISSKFPKAIVKYIGVIVGAELGILVARLIRR